MPDIPITKNKPPLLGFLITVTFIVFAPAFADNTITNDLRALQNTIMMSKQKDHALNQTLIKLETQKTNLLKIINDDRLKTAQLMHKMESMKKSPARLGFLSGNQDYKHYHYYLRSFENIKNTVAIQLSHTNENLNELEEKQNEIANYIRQRDLISETINIHLDAIQTLQENKKTIPNYASILVDLQKNYATIDDLIKDIDVIENIDTTQIQDTLFSMPVSGIIKKTSSGITIQTSQQSLVNAPANGIVTYANTLKNLGNIIIIKHNSGYLSILKGLGKIYVRDGLFVEHGEPLGVMNGDNTNKDKNSPMLYFELRYNGEIINPITKITGL